LISHKTDFWIYFLTPTTNSCEEIYWPKYAKLFVTRWSGFAVFVSIARYVHADILSTKYLFKPKLREPLQRLSPHYFKL